MRKQACVLLCIALRIVLTLSGDVGGPELPHIIRSKSRNNRIRAKLELRYTQTVWVGKGTQKRLVSPEWIKRESEPWFKGLYIPQ